MNQDKKPRYFGITRDEIGKLYDEVRSSVRNMITQPSLIITQAKIRTILLILDDELVRSEEFRSIIHMLKDKIGKVIGLYVPEEEDIIHKLREMGEDKEEILASLREFEVKKEIKIISELEELMRKENIDVEIEVRHKPRLDTFLELCEKEKPDLIIMSKKYSKTYADLELKHLIHDLIDKLECPILLV